MEHSRIHSSAATGDHAETRSVDSLVDWVMALPGAKQGVVEQGEETTRLEALLSRHLRSAIAERLRGDAA